MKWFMKILGIAGLAFCLCGFAMVGIGYAFGGGDYIRAENLADVKDVFFSSIGYDLDKESEKGGNNGDIKVNTGSTQKGSGAVSDTDSDGIKIWSLDDTTLSSVKSIKTDLGYIDFDIAVSEDDDFHLSYELHCMNNKSPLSYHLEDGVLTLTETGFKPPSLRKKFWSTGDITNVHNSVITLNVPSDAVLENCLLDVADSDLAIKGLHCNTLEMNAEDGDIRIEESVCSNATLKAADGDIIFADTAISGDVHIDTMDGDIIVSAVDVAGTMQLDTADGDISLSRLKASKSMKINTEDGDISVSGLAASGAVEITACDGDIAISGFTESGGIYVQTDYGDFSASALKVTGKMQIDTEDGDVLLSDLGVSGTVDIESECGDISIQIQKKSLPALNITMDTEDGDLSAARSLGGKKSRGKFEKSGSSSAYLKGYTEEGDISIQ